MKRESQAKRKSQNQVNYKEQSDQDSLYLPCGQNCKNSAYYKNQREGLKRKNLNNQCKVFKHSTWSHEENLFYKDFLKNNLELYSQGLEERRAMKINNLMSLYIETRSGRQCRSHHQKMLKYHNDIESIIAFIERKDEEKNKDLKVKDNIRLQEKISSSEIRIRKISQSQFDLKRDLWEMKILGTWEKDIAFL